MPSHGHGHHFPTSGGTEPYSYAITAGALPSGLSINESTGIVTGTPTEGGNFDFTVTVTDSSTPTPLTASVECSILVTVTPTPCVNKVRLQIYDDGAGMYVADFPVSTLLETGDNGVPFLLPSPIVFNKRGIVQVTMSNVNDGEELPVNAYLCFTFGIRKKKRVTE